MMTAPDPRAAAVDCLVRVEQERSFLEPLLADRLERLPFACDEDRGLFTELAYGTLRLKNRLDWIIDGFLHKGPRSLETGLRMILRVALYQIFCMDRVPPYAAVNEAVRLAKRRYPGRESLANGLLRNALRKGDAALPVPFPDAADDLPGFLSTWHSHPRRLVEEWIGQYGPEETAALCEANNRTPPFVVRVNRLRTDPDAALAALADAGIGAERTRWSPDGLRLERGHASPRRLSLIEAGHLQVQDEASQLVSHLLAPRPGDAICDLCSGAGVKATHLAALMGNRGRIVAIDRNARKLAQGEELARLLGARIIERRPGDARRPPEPRFREFFDGILVDAPCSGLGTVRRRPEIKWFAGEGEGWEPEHLQGELLRSSAGCLKRGGRLVYCTCTLSARENEQVVQAFLEEHREFSIARPGPHVPEALIDAAGFFRTLPHRHDMDGFFGAVLERRA